ncbi:hypothetical protein BDV25DRAFT_143508 [Aspergillus avenaceus]|uniref:Uncharacterized protein n=1 Tax=Aspergillus avenaceus TaxID=36643 RepID=A0A5N6TK46_ASPAV|nr:hypothetical protein BDV25DRAFT_143508 [Aspergillus avenaceus]
MCFNKTKTETGSINFIHRSVYDHFEKNHTEDLSEALKNFKVDDAIRNMFLAHLSLNELYPETVDSVFQFDIDKIIRLSPEESVTFRFLDAFHSALTGRLLACDGSNFNDPFSKEAFWPYLIYSLSPGYSQLKITRDPNLGYDKAQSADILFNLFLAVGDTGDLRCLMVIKPYLEASIFETRSDLTRLAVVSAAFNVGLNHIPKLSKQDKKLYGTVLKKVMALNASIAPYTTLAYTENIAKSTTVISFNTPTEWFLIGTLERDPETIQFYQNKGVQIWRRYSLHEILDIWELGDAPSIQQLLEAKVPEEKSTLMLTEPVDDKKHVDAESV